MTSHWVAVQLEFLSISGGDTPASSGKIILILIKDGNTKLILRGRDSVKVSKLLLL